MFVTDSFIFSLAASKVAIESASNAFIEALHKAGDLSYPLVVSDNNQIMNFQWNRNSGIRIYVRVNGKLY